MLRDLSIKQRLTTLGALLSALMLLSGLLGLYDLRQANQDLHAVYAENLVPLRQLKTMADLYAVEIVDHAHKANLGVVTPDSAHRAVVRARREAERMWLSYTSYQSDEAGRIVGEIHTLKEAADTSVQHLADALAAGERETLAAYVGGEMYPSIDPISERLNRLSDLQQEEALRRHREGTARYERTRRRILVSLGLGLLLAGWICVVVIRGVTVPLEAAVAAARRMARGDVEVQLPRHRGDEVGALLEAMGEVVAQERVMAETAERIAGGDLSAEVVPRSPEDRLGVAFAAMQARLRETIQEVGAGAEALSAAAAQVAATAEALSRGALEQVEAVEGTRRGLDALGEGSAGSAARARETAALAGSAAEEAEATARALRETLRDVRTLAEQGRVVGDAAAQTTTLALVAGIEAARAGEAGRALAEAVTEVRRLAERSREAAAGITRLAEETLRAGEGVSQGLASLFPRIERTASLAETVGSDGRAREVEEGAIRASVDGVHAVALETAACTEELASTAEELSAQAMTLHRLVAVFRTGEEAPPALAAGILSPLPPLPALPAWGAAEPGAGAEAGVEAAML